MIRLFLGLLLGLVMAGTAYPQNVPFSQFVTGLPAAGSVNSSDYIYLLQGGVSKKAQISQLPSGGGGGGVTSLSNADGTLTFSAATGAVVGSVNRSNANTWLAVQSFNDGNLSLNGLTSGNTILKASAVAGTTTATFPANTGMVAETNFVQTFSAGQTFSSSVVFSGLSIGTQVSCLGLDSGNHLVFTTGACSTTAGSITIGTTPIIGGTIGNCLTVGSGNLVGNAGCGGGGGALNITRAQIPSTNTGSAQSLILTGYTTPGDLGAGAPYTCSGQTVNSFGAIIDSAGNWCAFDLGRVNTMGGFQIGWFGAVGNGVADDTAAIQQAMDVTLQSRVNKLYCASANIGNGGYAFSYPLFYDPPGSMRGQGAFTFQGYAGWYSPGYVVTQAQTPATTAASGSGTSATLTFAAQPVAPVAGSTIQVSGVTPSGYNGNFTLQAGSTTSVTYPNITTGAQTVAGTVTMRIPYVNNTTQLAHGQPGSPDYSGNGMDAAYRIINSTSAVTYNPTYTFATPANALAAASFKGSGTIGTPVTIARQPNAGPGTATTVTVASPTAALITVLVTDTSGNGITGVVDSKGNTYVSAGTPVDNPTLGGAYIFYAANATALVANTDTITVNGPSAFTMIALSTTGIATTTPLDKYNTKDNTSTSTNSPSVLLPASGSFSQANELVVAMFMNATYITGNNAVGWGFTESANFTTATPNLWTPGAWLSGSTYAAGNVVVYEGILWQSLQQGNIGHNPQSELGPDGALIYWQPISLAPQFFFPALLYGPPQLTPGAVQFGCVLKAGFNNTVALTLPAGNGVTVDSVNVWAPGGTVHCGQPGTGAGIVTIGTSAGANETLIRNSSAFNFYFGFLAGVSNIQALAPGQAALAAENKWDNDRVANACIGAAIINTEGFINSIIEGANEANTNVLNTSSVGTVVIGGNYSEEGNLAVGNDYPSRTFPILLSSAAYDASGIVIKGTVKDGASFTGSISGNTLTVSAVTGTINIGDVLTAPSGNIINGNTITGGGGSTWTVAYAQTVSSEAMLTGDPLLNASDMMICGPDSLLPVHFWTGPGLALGGASFIGSISGTSLNVDSMTTGSLAIGQQFTSPNVSAYTAITDQISGTPGGVGIYTISQSQTLPLGTSLETGNFYFTGQNCNQATYNAWNLNPVDGAGNTVYGLIPVILVEYHKNTHAAVWRVIDEWYQAWGGNSFGGTALTTAIAAQTTIYAAEKARAFVGAGITVDRVHLETLMPWQLVDSTWGFGAPAPTTIKNAYINAPADLATGTTSQFYAQQSFPFIYIPNNGGNVYLENICCNMSGETITDNLMVDFHSPTGTDEGRLFIKGSSFGHLNFRYPANSGGYFNMTNAYGGGGTPAFGSGDYETTPWKGYADGCSGGGITPGNCDYLNRMQGWNSGPYMGVRPAPWSTPCIAPSQWAQLISGTPPAITVSGSGFAASFTIPYPILWSGQQYKVCDWNFLGPVAFNAGTTYGQGQLVTSGGTLYIGLTEGNVGNTPPSAANWLPMHWGFISAHGVGFSYGQNIGTALMGAGFTWRNTSNSPIISVPFNGTTNFLGLFFPGLVINLAGTQTGCTGTESFIIREVHKNLQYMALLRVDKDLGGTVIPAWSPSTPFLCSNTTIGQSSYAFTNLN
jgi:hypothetical protein